jgi:hypothetical protein
MASGRMVLNEIVLRLAQSVEPAGSETDRTLCSRAAR